MIEYKFAMKCHGCRTINLFKEPEVYKEPWLHKINCCICGGDIRYIGEAVVHPYIIEAENAVDTCDNEEIPPYDELDMILL